VLACADSRVPVELIFDQTVGHIFVARVAGNMVTPEIIATLEYGVAVLGVKVLLVLGHTSCGAVKAAMKSDTVPGQISVLYKHLRPAVEKSSGNLDRAIGLNAEHQAELLRTSSTVVRDALKGGKVKVVSGELVQWDEVHAGGSYLSSNDPRLHYGLGKNSKVDLIEIHWPDGKVEAIKDVAADKFITIEEQKGITRTSGPTPKK